MEDTICAIATSLGVGAISIIRLSGKEAIEKVNSILKKAKENYLYTNCINTVEETKKKLKQNANYDMSIDNMIFNMCKQIPFERNEI